MPPRRAARSVSRKSTPLSPPKASSTSFLDASYNKTRPSKSSSRDVAAAQHQLQNIDEVLVPLVEESEPQKDDDLDNRFSPSREPSSDGSDLESMLDQLDPVAIIDNITLLHDDARALLDLFDGLDNAALHAFVKKLSVPNSPEYKRFRIRERRFLTTREPYGELKYIRPNLILHGLATSHAHEATPGPWRPDAIFHLANLALQMITVLSGNPEDQIDYLQYMFNNFPLPFTDLRLFPLGDHMLEQTTDLSLELFTQFYIYQAEIQKTRPDFDPGDLLDQILYGNEESRPWSSTHPSTGQKYIDREDAITRHLHSNPQQSVDVDALKQQFPWSDFVVQLASWTMARKKELHDVISLNGGVETIAEMFSARYPGDTLEVAEETGRDPPQVIANSFAELQGSENGLTQTSDRRDSPSGPPTGSKLNARYNGYKAIKAKYADEIFGTDAGLATASEVESIRETPQSQTTVENSQTGLMVGAEPSAHTLESFEVGGEDDDDDEKEALILTQQTDLIIKTLDRQKEESNKENKKITAPKPSLLDRQEGAEKVPWSEAPEDDSPRQPEKRQRSETEASEGEDEYETDQRVAKRPRQAPTQEVGQSLENDGDDGEQDDEPEAISAGGQPPRSNSAFLNSLRTELSQTTHQVLQSRQLQASSQRPTIARPPLDTISPQRAPSSSAPNPQRVAPPPAQRGAPPIDSHTPQYDKPPRSQVALVNQEAKLAARLSREIRSGRQVQNRRPYTEAEVERLMEMVALYGPHWALILKEDLDHAEGPLLQDRSQVQLKDKARNIKLDYLKARRRLPEGFESVSIGSRQINNLRQLGIDYVEGRFQGVDHEF